eukprot:1021401-Pyramimonas_sp.AAC.1
MENRGCKLPTGIINAPCDSRGDEWQWIEDAPAKDRLACPKMHDSGWKLPHIHWMCVVLEVGRGPLASRRCQPRLWCALVTG